MSEAVHIENDAGEREIREQLDRILASGAFAQSQRRRRFLHFLVDETLAGRGNKLKGYVIAVEVFDRPSTFDPQIDPVVRIEAGRLRDKLREYYDGEGRNDPIRIELPKGSYAPRIEVQQEAVSTSRAETGEPSDSIPRDFEQASNQFMARGVGPWLRAFAATRSAALWSFPVVLILVAAASLWGSGVWNSRPPLPDKPSIAVLPFDNIGQDARWDRFADGMTEDIITDLSHARELIVIARNSTEVYKGKPIDIRQIGRDLNVKYVLEGSIQSSAERLRVTAQLVDATSGSHVWSERYDRRADDLFAVQSELTQRRGSRAKSPPAQAASELDRVRDILARH